MGRALYDGHPSAREVFAQADSVLGVSLSALCFTGPATELNDTVNTQPAILTLSIAALRAMEGEGAGRPQYVAGHSLGEYSALVCAGSISFPDALGLVRERGRLMKKAGEVSPGGMAAVIGLTREQVDDICERARRRSGEYVGIANDNCPGQIVVSGTSRGVDAAVQDAKLSGAKRTIGLAVSVAAHSPLMGDAAGEFAAFLERTPILPPQIPVVSNSTARPVSSPNEIREALHEQLTSPVLWSDSVRWMVENGVAAVVEVGPGEVLSGLVRRIDRSVSRTSTDRLLGH